MAERVYWINFRLGEGGEQAARRDALDSVLSKLAGPQDARWTVTDGFLLLQSVYPLGTVATRIKAAIDPAADMAVIGMLGFDKGWVLGEVEDPRIFDMAPGMKWNGPEDSAAAAPKPPRPRIMPSRPASATDQIWA